MAKKTAKTQAHWTLLFGQVGEAIAGAGYEYTAAKVFEHIDPDANEPDQLEAEAIAQITGYAVNLIRAWCTFIDRVRAEEDLEKKKNADGKQRDQRNHH